MNTRTRHQAEAIVLHGLDYGESDRIVTFYTSEFGKIKGIAKGARRSRKRFANTLELFCCCRILFSRRGRDSLALIEDSRVENHFVMIRDDLEKTLIAAYLVELVDQFTLEGKKGSDLFQLLKEFLTLIDQGRAPEALVRFFEIRLLKHAGYEPVLDRCLTCQQPVERMEDCRFSVRAGGLRCRTCQNGEHHLPVSLGTIKTLLMGKDLEASLLNRLVMSAQSAEESRRLLADFILHLLGRELKSLKVLHQVRKMSFL
jgi:DNA repair protein RecO (recombination protein O)